MVHCSLRKQVRNVLREQFKRKQLINFEEEKHLQKGIYGQQENLKQIQITFFDKFHLNFSRT